jgi:hypothetical protein
LVVSRREFLANRGNGRADRGNLERKVSDAVRRNDVIGECRVLLIPVAEILFLTLR